MAKNVAELQEELNWHWRNTMRPIRFFALDAKAAIPFLLMIPYARWSTLTLTIIVVMLFLFLEKRGLTFPAAMRSARRWLIGDNRPAQMSFRYRRLRDFG